MNKEKVNTLKHILLQFSVIAFITLMLMFAVTNVSAEDTVMRRYALYVGSNYGGRDRVTLSYAVSDARTVSDVMQQLGGVMPTDSIILTDPSPAVVKNTIGEIKNRVKNDVTKRSEFFFYYSGHSDEKGLLLGDSVYRYEDLKKAIDSVEADVNIAVLDSCSSGAFTRMKGGVRRSPFLSDESVVASGHAFLTSSSEDEAAQESDDLGASFFTHYFVTALRGAADSALDGTVSLNEAYSYASGETLSRTEDTLAGPQHPSYDIQLAGTGELILTDLRAVSEQIMFEEKLRGRIFVRDSAGRLVVELKKIEGSPLAVSIGPGRYSMILDDGDQLLSADLMLTGGSKIIVMKDEFYPVPRSVNTVRGGTHVASDDGRSVDKPAQAEPAVEYAASPSAETPEASRTINDTAAELDVIAERARKRALEAAGMSTDTGNNTEPAAAETGNQSEVYETENGSVKFTPSSSSAAKPETDTAPVKAEPEVIDRGFDFGIVASADNLKGVQLGAIGGEVEGFMDGIQIGGVFTEASGKVEGVQVAGVFATADEDVDGLQIAGVWCEAEGDVLGGQISGIWNSAHDVSLAQVSGIFNVAEGKVMGAQASGIFNVAEDKVTGGQVAGIFNTAKDVDGVQVAGIMNIAEDVRGGQLGLLNFGGDVYGTQIGLINISEDLHGLPIGLINISENGLNDFSVWYSDNDFINFGFQIGTSTVYTFMHAGFSENWTDAASAGLGMGLELGGDKFFIDADLYGKSYQEGMGSAAANMQSIFTGNADIFPAARISAGLKFFDFISVFAGMNLDCNVNGIGGWDNVVWGETIAESYSNTIQPWTISHDYGGDVKLFPTWFVGVRL